jgi:hypothetical protein
VEFPSLLPFLLSINPRLSVSIIWNRQSRVFGFTVAPCRKVVGYNLCQDIRHIHGRTSERKTVQYPPYIVNHDDIRINLFLLFYSWNETAHLVRRPPLAESTSPCNLLIGREIEMDKTRTRDPSSSKTPYILGSVDLL